MPLKVLSAHLLTHPLGNLCKTILSTFYKIDWIMHFPWSIITTQMNESINEAIFFLVHVVLAHPQNDFHQRNFERFTHIK